MAVPRKVVRKLAGRGRLKNLAWKAASWAEPEVWRVNKIPQDAREPNNLLLFLLLRTRRLDAPLTELWV